MLASRVSSIAILFLLSFSPPAATSAPLAPLLPEVQKHMDLARKCVESRTFEFALAHADLVLVSDEVSYSVSYEKVQKKQHDDCVRALKGAFVAWERALDNTITFREEPDPAKADMTIRFQPDVMMGKEPVAGFVNWKRTMKTDGDKVLDHGFKARLQLRTRTLEFGAMPFEAMRHEACHEIGHVLGLDDSPTVGDLMGPLDLDHPVSGPTPREAEAVKQLRAEAKKIEEQAKAGG